MIFETTNGPETSLGPIFNMDKCDSVEKLSLAYTYTEDRVEIRRHLVNTHVHIYIEKSLISERVHVKDYLIFSGENSIRLRFLVTTKHN